MDSDRLCMCFSNIDTYILVLQDVRMCLDPVAFLFHAFGFDCLWHNGANMPTWHNGGRVWLTGHEWNLSHVFFPQDGSGFLIVNRAEASTLVPRVDRPSTTPWSIEYCN